MIKLQTLTDKAAIGLSVLCIIHCLVIPVMLIIMPAMTVIALSDEFFHRWLLILVIPISLFALTLGCRKHKRYSIFLWGISGLILLVLLSYLGHDVLSETGEKLLTVLSATILAYGHLRNHQLCKKYKYRCK